MERFVRLSRLSLTWVILCLVSECQSNETPVFEEAALEFFEKEVRPILVSRCYECHSAEKGTPRGGLRLDSRDALLKGGDTGPGVTLDKPAESLFLSSINYGDIYQMPPKSKLPSAEIAILTRWVELGLPWPKEVVKTGTIKPFNLAERTAQHWCWQGIKKVDAPQVSKSECPLSEVDRFILASLEAKGLMPASPAEKRTLLRRVYFDLVGLPPSPEEVEQFVHDEDPKALEVIVDRLLASVQFGERWGRHWLDLTRYAETRGHEFEPVIPNAWQFRDYVIRAINSDVPYDRFLAEQIAGDLIEPRWRTNADPRPTSALPVNESLIGTGFWFLGEEVHSPVDIRKDETDRMDNRLDVMSKTFLGLTVSCARCHDHKFDAISQRDYYALAGFAISGSYRQARVDTAVQHHQIALKLASLRKDTRRNTSLALIKNTKPVLERLEDYWFAADQSLEEGISLSEKSDDSQQIASETKRIIDIATEKRLDSDLLLKWCRELKLAKENSQHPLHELFQSGSTPPARESGAGPSAVGTAPSRERTESIPGLIVDFGDPCFRFAMQDGVSFGLRPVPRGQLLIAPSPNETRLAVARIGGWERDLFWRGSKLAPGTEVDNGTLGAWQLSGRMVRSPEFTLNKRNVWYLVRGSIHAYASVNSHLIVVGPLHGSVFREYKHTDDQWHWVSHDLSLYPGHRMHLEFAPADDGPCAIAMVVQTDDPATLPAPNDNGVRLEGTSEKTTKERVLVYAAALKRAVSSLIEPESNEAKAPVRLEHSDTNLGAQATLADWFVSHTSLFSLGEFKIPNVGLLEAEAELAEAVQWESTLAPAMLEGNGVDEFLLVRGNSNAPKEPIPRRFLEALHSVEAAPVSRNSDCDIVEETGSRRLELVGKMLASPLVPRVAVNRIWHHLFGRGIVPTVDNMGVLGLPPSHPELLDYLAAQFMQNGWSTKRMIRSLILSRTYQMSSHPTEADAVDPNNELWHRMPIKRLEGEVIRDSLLAVSGRLDRTAFGPSVPVHLTEFMQGRGRPGVSGPLDGNGRRSIYISVRRNFLSPMMLAFDTPSPFSTVGRRTISNVPAQALILMNDPFVIEQANLWAAHLLADSHQTTDQRLNRAYLTAFARPPTASESSEANAFLTSQGVNQPELQQAAWGHLCHVLFNVKEFVFVE